MVITKELKDELNAVLKVVIVKDDYEPNVEKKLTDYRKKAKIDGFRPGKVPAGMIKKLYGKSVMVDEINNLLTESLPKYIQDEHINILGNPLPSETEQKQNDWENSSDFEFAFDLGLSPEFEVNFSKKDKFKSYNIKPDPKLIQTYIDNYTRRFGTYKTSEVIESGNEMVKGTFIELSSAGIVKENGYNISDCTIYLEFMKDEDIKKSFIGNQTNGVLSFNLRKAYPNDVELASILHLKKEETAGIDSDFQFTIESISKFENAILNQELFDKIFGVGIITSIEQFNSKLENDIILNLSHESDIKFRTDAKDILLKKSNFKLPVEFLKRWILSSNEGKSTAEEINANFDHFENDLKWQLIQNKIVTLNDLQLTEDEILEFATRQTRMYFEQYGLSNVTDEQIYNFASEQLKKDDYRKRIIEQKMEDKVFDIIRDTVTVETVEVNNEEFDKIMENK
jgi:trigger factor